MPAPTRGQFLIALAVGLLATTATIALGGSGRGAAGPGLACAAVALLWLMWRRT
jgi:hypothetical protein